MKTNSYSRVYPLLFGTLLFCGPNFVGIMGLDPKYYFAAIMALCIPLIVVNKNTLKEDKRLLFLLLFCTTYGVYRICSDKSEGARFISLVIMSTPFYFASFPREKMISDNHHGYPQMWSGFLKLFLIFFVIETLLAATERVIGTNIFGLRGFDSDLAQTEFTDGFRSCSLHGHPLQNALIVSTSMSFILISKLNVKMKMFLWSLGFFSILCFNTRSSIVGNALLFFVYALYLLRKGGSLKKQEKRFFYFMFVVILISGLILFFYMGFGSRLMEMGLFDDDSAQVRLDVGNIFDFYPLESFLWGLDGDSYDLVLKVSGIDILENFYLVFMLRCGFVFLLFYLFLYIRLIVSLYKGYDNFTKWYTGGAFILLASTNNSLSTTGISLFLFLMLIVIFNPHYYENKVSLSE